LTRLPRSPWETPPPLDPAQQPLRKVELWDLVSAFGRLMRETAALQPRQIVMDETPIHVHMERILQLLVARQRLTLIEVFTPPHTRGRLLGIFLALLELIKTKQIDAEQGDPFGDIILRAATATRPPA
jgi:segregation and condensation protein A